MRAVRALAPAALALLISVGSPVSADDKPKEGEKAPSQDEPKGGPEVEIAKQVVGFLKSELDLSEEQTGKVRSIIEEAMKEAMGRYMKYMNGGEAPPSQEEMEKQRKELQERIVGRIRDVLDDAQKRELEAVVNEFETRSGRWKGGSDRPGGDAAQWLEGDLPSKDVLIARAEKALILSEDERKVLLPLLDRAVAARIALREAKNRRRTDLQQAVHAGAKEDEVKERLHEMRSKEEELQSSLSKAEDALRELVTVDQEARLVAIGILD